MRGSKLPQKDADRRTRLLLGGRIPKWIRCYDNGESADRYTIVFTGNIPGKTQGTYPYLALSAEPCHPQGVGLHCETAFAPVDVADGKWPPVLGRKCHLGTRIAFTTLPLACKRVVMNDYFAWWGIKGPKPEFKK